MLGFTLPKYTVTQKVFQSPEDLCFRGKISIHGQIIPDGILKEWTQVIPGTYLNYSQQV